VKFWQMIGSAAPWQVRRVNWVGANVVATVGEKVVDGLDVGDSVGVWVDFVGGCDGVLVGSNVGAAVKASGESVGGSDGVGVGSGVGPNVGVKLGDTVTNWVGSCVTPPWVSQYVGHCNLVAGDAHKPTAWPGSKNAHTEACGRL
jgi:hypothetical protein